MHLTLERLHRLIEEVYPPATLAQMIDDEVNRQVLAAANHFTTWLYLNGILQGLRDGSMTVVDTPFLAVKERHYTAPPGEDPPAPVEMIPKHEALAALENAVAELDPDGWDWAAKAERLLDEATGS